MQTRSRSLTWRGQAFHFAYLPESDRRDETALWAVSRGGEFIGMMPCSPEVTTQDFDRRGFRWLSELLGDRRAIPR